VFGGLKRGGVSLLYGEPGTGKTTLALQAASSAAKKGLSTLFIDADNSFYPERLTHLAGDNSEVPRLVFVSKPASFFSLTHLLANLGSYISSGVVLIVVDTMTSLYRNAMDGHRDIFSLNRELNLQIAYLAETARVFSPVVLITSQVRSVPQKVDAGPLIEPVANRVLKFWSQQIFRISSLPEKGLKELYVEKTEDIHLANVVLPLRLGKEGFS
jgi:DNA repair protein RadB